MRDFNVRTYSCPTDCKRKQKALLLRNFSSKSIRNLCIPFFILFPTNSLVFVNHFSEVMETTQNHGQGSQLCSVTIAQYWQRLFFFPHVTLDIKFACLHMKISPRGLWTKLAASNKVYETAFCSSVFLRCKNINIISTDSEFWVSFWMHVVQNRDSAHKGTIPRNSKKH